MLESVAGTVLKARGLPGGAFAWWLLQEKPVFPVLVILPTDEEAESTAADLEALGRLRQDQFQGNQVTVGYLSEEDEASRLFNLSGWMSGRLQFLCAASSLLTVPLEDPARFGSRAFELRMGLRIPRDRLLEKLETLGFSRTDQVESIGEYAVRGEVLDLWPSGEETPLRCLWNLDVVEAIRHLDVATQRSFGYVDTVMLIPVKMPASGEGPPSTLLSYIPFGCWVVQKGGELIEGTPGPVLHVRVDEMGSGGLELPFRPAPPLAGNIALFKSQLSRWREEDWRCVVFCNNQGEADRLDELLERGPTPTIILGGLERGFLDPDNRLAVLANGEIFGRIRRRLRLPKFEGSPLRSFTDLKEGDFVVHERCGIGRYRGLEHIRAGKMESEYLRLDYKGGDKLFVPVFDLKQVQKYIGAEGKRPALSSMDTATWERTKARAREDIAALAGELLRRAALRAARLGHSFGGETHLEEEFGRSFIYQLTPDQARAIEEVKEDMISPRPMDRLVCGDVGYGKTEVAMRAAFKAVLGRKQVALLAPTTILAEQHLRTFTERFADYPVSIALLSRFQKPPEQKKILQDLRRGVIDIVIGTHRLLQPDVVFKDLGLLIVDEEHRFGVKDKQRLLAFRETIDVLTLTATPIPRTLAAGLGGLKGLSTIESAPEGRQPIATYVGVFDEALVQKSIEMELARSGQVYYIHNRVRTLKARESWLKTLLPGVRITAIHGQMAGPAIEKAMWEFLHRKFDILLSTTIVESGLDIPNVNTLIVEEAEEFGLAQLYQLRGRVGRTRAKAYCYLFYSTGMMSSEARKRLEAIREFGALGSGFHLALRDLEIRGAGNLLGPEQHGALNAVGLDTYGQLLADEIEKQKGEPSAERREEDPVFEVTVSAYLPADYVPSEAERINTYKRILSANPEELASLREELADRSGPLPPPAETLFRVVELRALARRRGVTGVSQDKEGLRVYFGEKSPPDAQTMKKLLSGAAGKVRFLPGTPQGIYFELDEPAQALDVLSDFLLQGRAT